MASTDKREIKMINGTVLLMKKTPLDLGSSQVLAPHETYEILGHKVILQLVSSVHGDQGLNFLNTFQKKFTPFLIVQSSYILCS